MVVEGGISTFLGLAVQWPDLTACVPHSITQIPAKGAGISQGGGQASGSFLGLRPGIACQGGARADIALASQRAAVGPNFLTSVWSTQGGGTGCRPSLHILRIRGLGLEMQRPGNRITSEIHGLGLDFSDREREPWRRLVAAADAQAPPVGEQAAAAGLPRAARPFC